MESRRKSGRFIPSPMDQRHHIRRQKEIELPVTPLHGDNAIPMGRRTNGNLLATAIRMESSPLAGPITQISPRPPLKRMLDAPVMKEVRPVAAKKVTCGRKNKSQRKAGRTSHDPARRVRPAQARNQETIGGESRSIRQDPHDCESQTDKGKVAGKTGQHQRQKTDDD